MVYARWQSYGYALDGVSKRIFVGDPVAADTPRDRERWIDLIEGEVQRLRSEMADGTRSIARAIQVCRFEACCLGGLFALC